MKKTVGGRQFRTYQITTVVLLTLCLRLVNCVNDFGIPKVKRQLNAVCNQKENTGESNCDGVLDGKLYQAQLGDACDPAVYRFYRGEYDDSIEQNILSILGKRLERKNADYVYEGNCTHYCPQLMCMSMVPGGDDGKNLVDQALLDCISLKRTYPYEGVCNCGYQWSYVDPLNPGPVKSGNIRSYRPVRGMDRRLIWDESHNRCAADHFGHCSLGDWGDVAVENRTYCYFSTDECLNRSAIVSGTSYAPLKAKSGHWYGICDLKNLVTNPFAHANPTAARNSYLIVCLWTFTLWLWWKGLKIFY